jgi:excisionase family DNA binding protein
VSVPTEWLTVHDVARQLKISRSAAYTLLRQLPKLRMGRITRVKQSALDAYLAARMVPSDAERQRQAAAAAPPKVPLTLPRQRKPLVPTQTRESCAAPPLIRPTRPRRSGPLAPMRKGPP